MVKGYFVKGAWISGIHPSMIGKKIVRTQKCICKGQCGEYEDYSHSINGLYGPRSGESEYCTLLGLEPDGSMHVSWCQMPKDNYYLPPYWNDGNWIEYTGE